MGTPQITSKNLQILSEQMIQEELAYKKCKFYQSCFADSALKNMCCDLATHHKMHFNALMQYLNSHN